MRLLQNTIVLLLLLAGLACAGPEPAEPPPAAERALVVYSGRSEALVGPLLERYGEETGVSVAVRYGGTAEMVATLLEEGANTPADLFLSQDAAALGALSREGSLRALPAELLGRVDSAYRAPNGEWVGLSGRARTVVYNPERITPEELPRTLEDLTDPRYAGRFGVAPTNASFQAHMAAYRATAGAEALEALLAGMVENAPRRYPKNSTIVDAVIRGEVEFGLVNHYYLWRALSEEPEAPGRNYFMPGGGVSSFVNLAGVGVLSDDPEAVRLVDWLLSETAQEYFARETYEYPLAAGVTPAVDLEPLPAGVDQPDFEAVSSVLVETLAAIQASGLVE